MWPARPGSVTPTEIREQRDCLRAGSGRVRAERLARGTASAGRHDWEPVHRGGGVDRAGRAAYGQSRPARAPPSGPEAATARGRRRSAHGHYCCLGERESEGETEDSARGGRRPGSECAATNERATRTPPGTRTGRASTPPPGPTPRTGGSIQNGTRQQNIWPPHHSAVINVKKDRVKSIIQ